ncbi:MAG: peptidase T [Spirochaetia bacterium]|nr:peptidase T [Spirochaetia bacterium]
MTQTNNKNWISQDVLERFLRYVQINTTSDQHIEEIPSTDGQWDLLRLLKTELEELQISNISLDEHGYLIARIPARGGADVLGAASIGLMAHVDTSGDMTGNGVKPQLHREYDGSDIDMGNGYTLTVEENPALEEYIGDTIITSDGTTLLGADDKAGVALIMTALKWLTEHPEIEHGPFEIIFTPDEETGKGMDKFPLDALGSKCCYTFDGGERGIIESECFNAYIAKITFQGKVVHLGDARGKLVNALTMAGKYVSMLPQNESPEATDGRFGYYAPFELHGELDNAELTVYLRDFEVDGMQHRVDMLHELAKTIEGLYPGGSVEVHAKKMYTNMREHIAEKPHIMNLLEEAIRQAGLEPKRTIIRGGTDGARLSEMGVPTPNVFTGGYNFHSRYEWASLSTMVAATETAINLIRLWATQAD